MLLLWTLVLGVCGDVALSMEGPRGKVTREMCSKPASQVPEEHWPYCCEGYGNHCEDFAASCYLDCQPVVSSGSDVTMVEERPGFCCALYNFCCIREFSRIGNLQKVETEEQYPTFHRFHVPGKQAPRWSPAPRKNIVRQDVNNDISESPSTVNRVGRPRTSSRSNGPRERLDRIDSKSSKSLDDVNNNFSSDLRRTEQQQRRTNPQPNVVKPHKTSKTNVDKPQRNQVRFPQRPQIATSNIGSVNTNKEPTTQADDSFGNIAINNKIKINSKNTENSDNNKNVHQNTQQLNREAENRELTLNRAGANRRENLSNINVNLKVPKEDNQELKHTNQPKSVILPESKESLPKSNAKNGSENKQVKEDKDQRVPTDQLTTIRQNNGQKVKIGRRVLVRTAPKKISKNQQEISKLVESEQSKSEVKPTANRRTIISNRQLPKTIRHNKQETSESTDSAQRSLEASKTAGRRKLISNRQNSKKISKNEQGISKSTDSSQNSQELKPTASIRTSLNTRQTGSRSRPTVSITKDRTRTEANQEDSNGSSRSGSRIIGKRTKQTVRIVIPDNTQTKSVKLPTITAKEQKEVLPKQRISIANEPVTEQIAPVASNIEQNEEMLKAAKSDQAKTTSDAKAGSLNTDKSPSYLPLGEEEVEGPKLDLDSSASQISEDKKINLNNLILSEKEKEQSIVETETESPQGQDENTAVTEVHDNNQNPLEIAKADKINVNQEDIEANNTKQTRSRSRTTVPISVTNSRNKATSSTGENSTITNSRTRSRSRSRSSSTRNQDPTLQEETISTSALIRGTTRSERRESFGRKDDRKSTAQTSPVKSEKSARRTTRRRGRQPT